MEVEKYPIYPVLIVDDEARALQSIATTLQLAGVNNVLRCQESREASQILDTQEIGVVLLDLSMPHLSGDELLAHIVETHPDVPVIIVTGANEVETAVHCMSLGAFDYIVKPPEKQRLRSSVKRAIDFRELRSEYTLLKERMLSQELRTPEAFSEIITQDPKMLSIFRYLETIAPTSRPVLITGETGVGKELVARAIHQLSQRKGEFIAISVAGLDDNLFSDTLFGHVKGAYTGADEARVGLVERAAQGTLFLDEIGDLSAASQVKLLRLLQEREYFPLGADRVKRSSARVVVATHRDLVKQVEEDLFRKDLYYRLQIHQTHLPPLRDRLGDLPLLVDAFLNQAAQALEKTRPTPPRELLDLLSTYSFPGNIRELEAMVFDAVGRHSSKKLSMNAFRDHIQKGRKEKRPSSGILQEEALLSFQRAEPFPTLKETTEFLVREALKRANNNQTIAAQLLGITPSALSKRLKRAQDSPLQELKKA